MKKSRSELYRDALREYLARHDEDEITRAYNEYAAAMTEEDLELIRRASREALKRVEW